MHSNIYNINIRRRRKWRRLKKKFVRKRKGEVHFVINEIPIYIKKKCNMCNVFPS